MTFFFFFFSLTSLACYRAEHADTADGGVVIWTRLFLVLVKVEGWWS